MLFVHGGNKMEEEKITMKIPIPKKTPIEMIEILPVNQIPLAKKFVELGAKLNCKNKVNATRLQKTWKCVYSITKPSRVFYTITCKAEGMEIKACLWNINTYCDYLNTCSDIIKNIITTAFDCHSCNPNFCKGGSAFTFQDKSYKKCVGCCFYFSNLTDEDWESLLIILNKEHESAKCKV